VVEALCEIYTVCAWDGTVPARFFKRSRAEFPSAGRFAVWESR
jgi:hypothetical protein